MTRAQPDRRLASAHRLAAAPSEALDECRDLRAMNADIGERPVVERHQFVKSALTVAPALPGVPRPDEEIDQRHNELLTRMVHCKNGDCCIAKPSEKAQSSHA